MPAVVVGSFSSTKALEVRSQTRLRPGTPNLQSWPSSPLVYRMTASRQPIEGPKLGVDGIDTVRPSDLSDKNSHVREVILIAMQVTSCELGSDNQYFISSFLDMYLSPFFLRRTRPSSTFLVCAGQINLCCRLRIMTAGPPCPDQARMKI